VIVILSDLDGTLLNDRDYSFRPAREALREIGRQDIPLVFVSSKTRTEIEAIRGDLDNRHPFISENGGAVFIPEGYFPPPVPESRERDGYLVIELGTSYEKLCAFLDRSAAEGNIRIRGFHSLDPEEIARLTGLTPDQAARAKKREYDEPFLFEGRPEEWGRLRQQAESEGLSLTRGGRFSHVTGPNDKGKAARILLNLYRARSPEIRSVGIGDAVNDIPLLEAVDRAILVQKPDGSYDPEVRIPGLTRAPGPGPEGWNEAILKIIGEFS